VSGDQPKGALVKVVRQPLALDRAVALQIVADADQRLGIDIDRWRAGIRAHESERIQRRGDAAQAAQPQQLLGDVGVDAYGRFAVALEDLLRHAGQIFLERIHYVRGQGCPPPSSRRGR
jgi:hypothetical protein